MPRLFLAIELPDRIRQELRQLSPRPAADLRVVREDQLHLTLHFLGDVDDACVASLMATVRIIHVEPFSLTLTGVGRFPPRGRASVLWAGLQTSAPLQRLHSSLGVALAAAGFPVERRAYTPHVTLARVGPRTPPRLIEAYLAEHASLTLETFPVDAFTLFESRRSPGSSTHIPLLRTPLTPD